MKKYFELFYNKSFSRFFIGINLANFSQSLISITIVWMIYEKTNQAFLIAVAGVLLQVPSMISGPFCGYAIDKIGASRIVSLTVFIKSVIFLALFLLPLTTDWFNIIFIIIALFINSAISPIISSCTTIITNQLLEERQLVSANSIINIFFDVAYIAGSIITGIVAINGNEQYAFLIASILFLISSFLFMRLEIKQTIKEDSIVQNKEVKSSIKQGFLFLIKNKIIFHLFVVTLLWNLLVWGVIPIVIPVFSKHVLSGGAYIYGWLNSAASIGIILGSVIVGALSSKWSSPKVVYYFIVLQSIFLMIFGLQSHSLISVVILVISGIFSAPVMIYKSTILQNKIPENMQGQVFSLIGTMVSVTYPIGGFIVGIMADVIPQNQIGQTVFVSGLIMLVVTVYFIFSEKKDLSSVVTSE